MGAARAATAATAGSAAAAAAALAAASASSSGGGSAAVSAVVAAARAAAASRRASCDDGGGGGGGDDGDDDESDGLVVPPPLVEARCHLPPLDGDRFVGRDDDVQRLAELLVTPQSASTANGHKGGGGAGSNGHNHTNGLPPRPGSGKNATIGRQAADAAAAAAAGAPPAVCVVGEMGSGKSCVVVAAARRLWEAGALPGGAYYIDLRVRPGGSRIFHVCVCVCVCVQQWTRPWGGQPCHVGRCGMWGNGCMGDGLRTAT